MRECMKFYIDGKWVDPVTAKSMDDLTRSQNRPRLGSGRSAPVAFHRGRLDDALVVATDGLFKYASPARIGATVRAGEASRIADRLVALVRLPSGGFQDDLGLVVVVPRQGAPYLVVALSFRVKPWIERTSRVADVIHAPRIGIETAQLIAGRRADAAVGVADFDHLPARQPEVIGHVRGVAHHHGKQLLLP